MGTSFNAQVVVGVRVEHREVKRQVKKFNPDTGEPYMKDVTEGVFYIKDTNTSLEPYMDAWEYINLPDSPPKEDLELHCTHYDSTDGWVLGKLLYEMHDERDEIVPIDLGKLTQAGFHVGRALRKRFEGEFNVGTHLILHAG